MTVAEKLKWTEKQYLEFERASQEKHEFLDGEIYAMSGGSAHHSIITSNAIISLGTQLRGSGCRLYNGDMRIAITPRNKYTYPDLSIVCGQAQYLDDKQDNLLNPTLILEVLSPSTENYDRGMKFKHYQSIESLQQYVLIAQDFARIECFTREEDAKWVYTSALGLDASITLISVGCILELKEIYENVGLERNTPEQ